MAGMPFHLEKGPVFATLEAKYNGNKQDLHDFLQDLWDGIPLGSHRVLTSPMHDGPAGAVNATGADRRQSMFTSWFGDDATTGDPQPAWGWHEDLQRFVATTGYWSQYYGDVRSIVTQTLLRAGEVSLGYARPEPGEPLPRGIRHWPVDFFWKCGQPRFEGWVTWRSFPRSSRGHVAVIFATPATPDTVLKRPAEGGHAVNDTDHLKWQGMWVTSHANHRQYRIRPSQPSKIGRWVVPTSASMFTRGLEEVGTWVPDFGLGGTPPSDKSFVQGTP